ncbi:MAG TPA: hypothetical protein PLB31_03400 [Fimbriimonadaceae bacterium]|nr:hypothetical protein [Armatimonadota bacterium]HCM73870.1 hypothetical protein [Armatimonadota bacterium]HRD31588.1 hypothetical protein [Fimbriimonadaceae bacterium]HRE93320.1 hypothetical protein [Fimbriimonadaceae bacterium]HRI73496.1 hypothetical protein [Fimbriimonadaceae bacterium]
MSMLPEDRDELMWELARDPLSEAAQQYRQRYPEDVAELESRASMLGKFTAAKPVGPAIIPAPHVLLEKPTPEVRMPRWSLGVAAALLIVSMALGYMAITRPQPQNLAIESGPRSLQATENQAKDTADESGERRIQGTNSGTPEGVDPNVAPGSNNTVPTGPQPLAPVQPADPTMLPITIQDEGTSLRSVIEQIGMAAGLTIEFAPGFTDSPVSVRYVNVPAMTILKTLGQSNGFTPLNQGDRKVLIVPATDPNAPVLQDPNMGTGQGLPDPSGNTNPGLSGPISR